MSCRDLDGANLIHHDICPFTSIAPGYLVIITWLWWNLGLCNHHHGPCSEELDEKVADLAVNQCVPELVMTPVGWGVRGGEPISAGVEPP